jgi:rod shape-determining protein MreC
MGAGVLLLGLSTLGALRPIEDVSLSLFTPIEDALQGIAQPVADVITNFGDIDALTRENEQLRTEIERLQSEIARLQEDATRAEELERLLGVKESLSEHGFVAARVIARDPDNLRRILAIDRGSSDGLKTGMTVVTEGNTIVGTVTRVLGNHAWVALVTDIDSAISSVVLESRAQGVVSGGYDGRLSMEFVSQGSAVSEGDTVVTSGLGGTYPAGLIIGQVTGVSGSPQEVFRRVTVAPLATLSRLETVLVINTFEPASVPTP